MPRSQSNPERILVTGGCGFVGSHLIEYLLQHRRARIWTLCRQPPVFADDRVTALSHDLAEPLDGVPLPRQLDQVYHCASSPSDAAPVDLFATNLQGTQSLLRYAERAAARRFVYVSSGGVTGYDRRPISESAAPAPSTPYLMAKLAGERVARTHHGSVRVTIVRLFFPYGPGQRHGLMPQLCKRLRRGEPIVVGPRGTPRVNPIHVRDAVRLIYCTAAARSTDPVVNVAGDEVSSMSRLGRDLGQVLALRPRYRRDPSRTLSLVGETRLLHRRYGRSRISLATGLAEVARASGDD